MFKLMFKKVLSKIYFALNWLEISGIRDYSKNVHHEYFCRFLYSVSGNVKRIKLATNSKKRLKYNKAVFTYKAMNNLTPKYITDLLKPVAETHNRTLRSSVNGAVPRSRSSLFDSSYSYTPPNLWNSIHFRNASYLTSFKNRIKSIL